MLADLLLAVIAAAALGVVLIVRPRLKPAPWVDPGMPHGTAGFSNPDDAAKGLSK